MCVWGGGGRGANRGVMVGCVTSRRGVMSMPYLIRTKTKETIETVRINGVSILRRLELKIMYVIQLHRYRVRLNLLHSRF